MIKGEPFQATNQVSDTIKDVEFRDATKELILGPPLVLTKENAGQFDY